MHLSYSFECGDSTDCRSVAVCHPDFVYWSVGEGDVFSYLRATVGFTYDFCAYESNRAITKRDGNSSSTVMVGILSGRVRVPLLVILQTLERTTGSEQRRRLSGPLR